MQITEITVNAGRTFNHPMENYSNLRFEVEMRAVLEPGEDSEAAAKGLQGRCEQLAEDHKQGMLRQIFDLAEQARRSHKRLSLQRQIETAQAELEQLGPPEKQQELFENNSEPD